VGGPSTAGAKRHPDQLRGIRSPLGDRGHRSCAGQHRRGGYGQDRDQRVASATATSRVADRGEVGQQERRFGLLEGLAWASWLRRLGSRMMAQQAPVSVAVIRRWVPHDPGRSCLLDVITHYVTNQPNSQNDGALDAGQPGDKPAVNRWMP
jgi:hypothetical protein